MKKVIIVVLLLLVTGGITYALKRGAFKDSGEDGKKVESGNTNSPKGEGGSSGSGDRKGSRKDRGRRVSVEVAEVKVGGVQETLGYVGSLLPETSVEVFSKVEGHLEEIFVDVGSWIKEGGLIARIEQEEIIEEVRETEASLRVAQATLKGKEAEMKHLERQLERSKQLFQKNFISRQELDSVETQHYSAVAQTDLAKAQVAQKEAALQTGRIRLRNTEIRSPISGYVAKRLLDRGSMVKTDTLIISLVDIHPVLTLISVVEKDYRRMEPGLPAAVRVDAYPGRTFTGKVARVSPALEIDTRTADVEIEIPNPEGILKPGMFAKVEIVAHRRSGALLVPEGALVKLSEGHGVFRLRGKGSTVELIPVTIGLSQKGWVEVQGSLESGNRVVTLGSSLLKDGQKVRVIEGPLSARGVRGTGYEPQ